jgi:hypothetical protein
MALVSESLPRTNCDFLAAKPQPAKDSTHLGLPIRSPNRRSFCGGLRSRRAFEIHREAGRRGGPRGRERIFRFGGPNRKMLPSRARAGWAFRLRAVARAESQSGLEPSGCGRKRSRDRGAPQHVQARSVQSMRRPQDAIEHQLPEVRLAVNDGVVAARRIKHATLGVIAELFDPHHRPLIGRQGR